MHSDNNIDFQFFEDITISPYKKFKAGELMATVTLPITLKKFFYGQIYSSWENKGSIKIDFKRV